MRNKLKAIFLDHMGTMVTEESDYAREVIKRAYLGSRASSPEELADFWFKASDQLTDKAYGDNFKNSYEISLEAFQITDEKFSIREDLNELVRILEKNWIYAPAFEDTVEFFDKCPLDIYVLSNNDDKYIVESMKNIGVKPAAIITSEMSRAYKPRKEIFQKALEISGCEAGEVVHIGDSIRNDILGARALGIEAWLIDRKGRKRAKDIEGFTSLLEALDKIVLRMNEDLLR